MKKSLIGSTKSKTVWFGAALSLLGLLQANVASFNLSPQTQGLVITVIGGAVIVLRAITTGGLADKVETPEDETGDEPVTGTDESSK